MQKLEKNIDGYLGEKIDIISVLKQIEAAAQENDWERDVYFQNKGFNFIGLKRKGNKPGKNVYISSGMHGDEPAGPLAALQLIKDDLFPKNLNIWFCPCLNPLGFVEGTRTNEVGIDLNRDYRSKKTSEVRAHIEWLERQPDFDLSLCLHEDWESKGFYILDESKNTIMARSIINQVKNVFPIDESPTIEGFSANLGIVNPNIDIESRNEWPEAFYLIKNKGTFHYTFETSSDFSLEARVQALVTATLTACRAIE